ncbi:MAG: hypothetical protein AB7E24_11040 [Novosphingobium sp.]|uniref:hypothetical protein n=1 Tax=Novosphingobium indicum TaxID=462949 RepID=UPI001669F752|nr:hypothetical protein [Novosphingobium indicum]
MDLNQLLFQHQLAIIRHGTFDGGDERRSHFDLVRYYERRIARLRHEMGVSCYPAWL